jgi:hypothetical protein
LRELMQVLSPEIMNGPTRVVSLAVTAGELEAAGLWPVMIDVDQLENALFNLCAFHPGRAPGEGEGHPG